MSIDFMMPPQVLELRNKVRAFIKEEIEPAEAEMQKSGKWSEGIIELRRNRRG
jgi:hypothetical protein